MATKSGYIVFLLLRTSDVQKTVINEIGNNLSRNANRIKINNLI